MTVDKEKRSVVDIVDSIETKLDKIIGDNNMGKIEYARDLVSEIPTFKSIKSDEIVLLIDIYTAKKQLETAEYFQSYMTSNSPFMKEIGYPYIKEIKNLIKNKTECLVGEL